jgi:hypothetical protein
MPIPLTVQKGSWTVPGEVGVNGGVKVVKITSGVRIGLYGGGTTCSATCIPAKVSLTNRIVDPLQGPSPSRILPVAHRQRQETRSSVPGSTTT